MKELAKKFDHKEVEPRIYKMWEDLGVFDPKKAQKLREKAGFENKDESFCVLMPPPNANAPLHCGHATYAIQDLYTRWYRMMGYKTLYLPGTDHAGFETQVVYERKLKEKGKSRFDYDRETLFGEILDFVKQNSELATNQLKKIGMSADWDRNVFMLQDSVTDFVLKTFEKMHKDNLIYRDLYLVNYSPKHGTTFSNLETVHKETVSPLYYASYKFEDSDEKIIVATVRPETIFADVAIAVNPKDDRYKDFVGKNVINPLNGRSMPVIEDSYVDMEFGTGALKITPGHDFNDFEIGRKNNFEMISVVDLEGNMVNTDSNLDGMSVNKAREESVKILEEKNALEKIDKEYTNNLLVDYKDGYPIEPLLLPNWFVKMDTLAKEAIDVLNKDKISFYKPIWKNEMLRWLENIHDWPISRQIVFGIRIPVWYDAEKNPDMFVTFLDKNGKSVEGKVGKLIEGYDLKEISSGLQKLIAPVGAKYEISQEPIKGSLQETDTFDTWFSSGQWPMTTLGYNHDGKHHDDFNTFFPTTLMDSMWDILFFWIARMIMFSLYFKNEIPFKHVYIHGRIDDEDGQKMSKSKGNVIDPLDYVEQYGADALRMGMLVGGNSLARTPSFNTDKIRGYRNFANKLWNMARFMLMMEDNCGQDVLEFSKNIEDRLEDEDKKMLEGLSNLTTIVNESLKKYRIMDAGDAIYHFVWDELADKYIEHVKDRQDKKTALSVLKHIFMECLKLLHPFMPFVTEELWGILNKEDTPLIISTWPQPQA